jgi:hypothetical protein
VRCVDLCSGRSFRRFGVDARFGGFTRARPRAGRNAAFAGSRRRNLGIRSVYSVTRLPDEYLVWGISAVREYNPSPRMTKTLGRVERARGSLADGERSIMGSSPSVFPESRSRGPDHYLSPSARRTTARAAPDPVSKEYAQLASGSSTDFARFCLTTEMLGATERSLLLTIDFEAFEPRLLDLWLGAMERWSYHARAGGWRFSIFIALEDVARLRHERPAGYTEFIEQIKILHRSGARFYPHNHGFFDPVTGLQAPYRPQTIKNYGKRASFFYDIVHRQRMDLQGWLVRLLEFYDSFLSDAGIQSPRCLTFRAGGWDHGTTMEENKRYISAVSDAGFVYDSTATRGVFGTKSFHVGSPFGNNVFRLTPTLVEVAPCWSLNCGAGLFSRSSLGSLRSVLSQPQVWASRHSKGAFVTVLHFDHLFRLRNRQRDISSVSPSTVLARVDRFFNLISWVRTAFRLESMTFDELLIRD